MDEAKKTSSYFDCFTKLYFFRLVLTTKLNLLSVRVPVVGNESLWLRNQFSNLITRYNCLSDIHVLAESKISFKNKEKLFEKKKQQEFSQIDGLFSLLN